MEQHDQTVSTTATLIVQRIFAHFHHHINVRYRILIVNDPFNACYNWFLEWQRSGHRTRSVPLHSMGNNQQFLVEVIRQVRRQVGMSIVYRGFNKKIST